MPTISVLNYNSFQKPMGSNDVRNEFKGERNDLFGEQLARFDVVALQEQFTFANPRPVALLERALQLGFGHFYKSPEPGFLGRPLVSDGLLVLSRFPILEGDSAVFESSVSIDRLVAKGAVYALVQLPNGARLHLFNTHLLATFHCLTRDEYTLCKIRAMTQVVQLRAFVSAKLRAHFRAGDLALLCGDLNVDARNDDFSIEKVLHHVDIAPALGAVLRAQTNELRFYEHLLQHDNGLFSLSHTFFRDHRRYPVTLGNCTVDERGVRVPLERVITAEDERLDQASLDHVYELHVRDLDDRARLSVVPGSARVEEFFVDGQPFTQLSDHYGLSLQLQYN